METGNWIRLTGISEFCGLGYETMGVTTPISGVREQKEGTRNNAERHPINGHYCYLNGVSCLSLS